MMPHAFEHNEDPYRFIVQVRHGIDIDAVAVSGDIDRIGLNLTAASTALLVNLPDPRTIGLRASLRY